MDLRELQRHWHQFGKKDPLWAIIAWPEKKGNKWTIEEFFEYGEREIRALMTSADRLGVQFQRNRALDFGCGAGRLSQALADYFQEVVGVDIAPSMLKLAKQHNRHGRRCKYYLNEVENLGVFGSATFDFVYSNIVLQHMEPRYARSYISEFLRVLVPGGLVVFQVPGESINQPPAPKSPPPSVPASPGARVSAWRRFVKQVTPEPVLAAYRRVRDRNQEPRMEMYGIKKEEVEAFLIQSRAHILAIEPNDFAGPEWTSFRYFVTNRRHGENAL